MSGTRAGGKKAAEQNLANYGYDYYHRIGQIGGRKSRGGGFTGRPELARIAGAKGGSLYKSEAGKANISKGLKKYWADRRALATEAGKLGK